jgi:ligand-binding sensor domain-containing protein
MTALAIRRSWRKATVVVSLGRSCLFLGTCLVVALLCARGNALDPNRHISQYGHTVWRVADGAIDPTSEITQTADGYVWLGSPNGLLRFDGVKFGRYAPPGLDLPTRGFSFWLGARDGQLRSGRDILLHSCQQQRRQLRRDFGYRLQNHFAITAIAGAMINRKKSFGRLV